MGSQKKDIHLVSLQIKSQGKGGAAAIDSYARKRVGFLRILFLKKKKQK